MKKYFQKNWFLMAALMFSFAFIGLLDATADSPADKYKYGFKKAETVVITDTVKLELAPNNLSQLLASATIDTSVVVTVDVSNSIPNDLLILKLKADSTTRQVDFSTGFTAIDDSIVANKTKLFVFIYDGSKFLQIAESGVD